MVEELGMERMVGNMWLNPGRLIGRCIRFHSGPVFSSAVSFAF